MTMKEDYYKQLLRRYLDNDCTPQEVEEVLLFLQQDGAARILLEQMHQEFDRAMDQEHFPLPAGQRMKSRLLEKIGPGHFRQPFYKRIGFRVAAAALLVLLLGAGVYYLLLHTPGIKETAGKDTPVSTAPVTLPGRNKAYITMANGEQVTLDSGAATRRLQEHGNIVQLTNDQVTYRADSPLTTRHSPLAYNTLTVPRGGKMVALTLADGTRVWVNAASSIRYPAAFTGHERRVDLTGEAYFEVAHDRNRPFAVHTSQVAVQVLGTRFNVSAYEEDGQQQVVLVKGSVNVTTDTKNSSQLLSPGQMASYANGGQLTVTAVNTEEYTSWTKGYLILKRTSWEQLMRRLSRHYDVRISTNIPAFKEETFSGRLDLQANLEDMMNLICTGTPFIYQPTERKLIYRK